MSPLPILPQALLDHEPKVNLMSEKTFEKLGMPIDPTISGHW
jgi:hypothetical protein